MEKNNVSLGYNITDNLNFSYNYFETKVDYMRFLNAVTTGEAVVGDPFNARTYTSKQHTTQLNYNDENWKVGLYFNQANIEALGPSYFTTTHQEQKNYLNIILKKRIGHMVRIFKKIGILVKSPKLSLV